MALTHIFRSALIIMAAIGEVHAAEGDLSVTTQIAANPWMVQLEVDPAQTTSNALQKPNNAQGSRFDVVDYTGMYSTLGRFSLAYVVNWGREGSELRFDVVPFQEAGTETARSPLRYDGVSFQADLPLTVLYQFNTYRLTYDLPVFRDLSTEWSFRIGGTLAIRDAQTRLTQSGARANYINYGPVPLFYASSAWRIGRGWSIDADVDGFPAPGGGGLLDTSARAVWSMTTHASVFAGVRYQTGGATEDSIYTYFHQRSALAGLRFVF